MGAPMAACLLARGIDVVASDAAALTDERRERMMSAAEKGRAKLAFASATEDVASGESNATVVVTMLPSPGACKDVYASFANVRGGVVPSLFIDCSTNDPGTAKALNECVSKLSLHPTAANILGGASPQFVDAPVSGGVTAAAAGTLTFMVGANTELAASTAKPILSAMGTNVVRVGNAVGAGSVAKLCNNLALAVEMAGVAEALALGEQLGLSPDALSEVLNTSSGRCWSSDTYNPAPGVQRTPDGELAPVPANHGYDGGFATRLMLKDIGLAKAAAESPDALPMASMAERLYEHAAAVEGENKDFGVVYRAVYGGAGVVQTSE